MTHEIVLDIPKTLWWTSNSRLHWAAKSKRTAHIRNMARAHAHGMTPLNRVEVTAWISYPRAGTADPSNASPVVKAALDGITDAGGWPDDDSEHVQAVTYRRGPNTRTPGLWRVRLELLEVT